VAGLLVSESLPNTNAQRALSSSQEGRGRLEDYHTESPIKSHEAAIAEEKKNRKKKNPEQRRD
jgi:hypothetical protein